MSPDFSLSLCFKEISLKSRRILWKIDQQTTTRWPDWVSYLFSVQSKSLSCVQVFATPWMAACQASLSITNFRSLHKLMSIELVIPSNHLILCHPLPLLPSAFPGIRVFSKRAPWIRCPKYWSFSFSISSSNEYSGVISFRIDYLSVNWTLHWGLYFITFLSYWIFIAI